MGKALYRKYRSKSLSEIVGQEHIVRPLKKAIADGTVSHAYLFTGPRGVGKTSIARILAHEVNGFPYDEQTTHIDIIEIDAASNRRIDEIRELRDKVHIAPTSGKYKVYIIDEVHMLTREAFNALLKTLEEPPAHVIFVLATTELHKLPETIISRTQHFAFKPVSTKQVVEHLAFIAKQENIKIDEASLTLIAEHGEGSFRDSISLLDKIRHYGDTLTAADIEAVLGLAPASAMDELISLLVAHDTRRVVVHVESLRDRGIEAAVIAKQLSKTLRSALLNGTLTLSVDKTLHLLEKLIDVSASSAPHITLELALIEASLAQTATSTDTQIQQPSAPAATPRKQPVAQPKPKPASTIATPEPTKTSTATEDRPSAASAPQASTQKQPDPTPEATHEIVATDSLAPEEAWPHVLDAIRRDFSTLHSMLRQATTDFANDTLTLAFHFAFHQRAVAEAKNKKIIADLMYKQTGTHFQIECIKEEDAPQKVEQAADQPAETIARDVASAPAGTAPAPAAAITDIFGGGEILES